MARTRPLSMKCVEEIEYMGQKPKTCVAYCIVCHEYVFIAPKEELVKFAATQHVEQTHHTVVVGYEIYGEEQK